MIFFLLLLFLLRPIQIHKSSIHSSAIQECFCKNSSFSNFKSYIYDRKIHLTSLDQILQSVTYVSPLLTMVLGIHIFTLSKTRPDDKVTLPCHNYFQLSIFREMLVKENAQVLFRRKQIISEMVNWIYPISEVCNIRWSQIYIDSIFTRSIHAKW